MSASREPGQGERLLWPLVLVAAVVAYGLLSPTTRLRSSRPLALSYELSEKSEEIGRVPARLWRDPLRVEWPEAPSDPPGEAFFSGIQARGAGGERTILLLPVMLQGMPYVEDAHRRLNTRYAVLSALNVAGYVPRVDTRYLRAWREPGEEGAPSILIPYELFGLNGEAGEGPEEDHPRRPDGVLVLWINSERIGTMARLARVLERVREKGGLDRLQSRAAMIGPVSSDHLIEVLREGPEFATYSPWATISERELQRIVGGNNRGTRRLHRVIGSDEILVELIVRELRLRGRDPAKGGHHVALVAEWDTSYGRAFKKYLETWSGGAGNVHLYSYLRGVDGSLPPTGDEEDATPASRDPLRALVSQLTGAGSEYAGLERPEGRSQVDYVRRLVDRLRNDRAEWRRGGGRLVAIGVVGTDVYDKLLLLQALRGRFPGVVFFTTDLDARLLHPSERRWARNVLIASHYGLEVDPSMTDPANVPPFRDCYQTSVFVACLRAMAHERAIKAVVPPKGRLYEVGRDGGYVLLGGEPPVFPASARGVHRGLPVWRWALIVVVLFMGVGLLTYAFYRGRREPERGSRGEWGELVRLGLGRFLWFVGVPLALLWVVEMISSSEGEEPLVILGGVSVWPTVILRVVAAVLSGWFLLQIDVRLGRNLDEIERRHLSEYGIGRDGWERAGRWRWLAGWVAWIGRFLSLYDARSWLRTSATIGWGQATIETEGGRFVDGRVTWARYRHRSEPSNHAARTLSVLVLYLSFGWLLMAAFNDFPGAPVRGARSATVMWTTLAISVILVNLLVFSVWDVTRLCDRFVRNLTALPTIWRASEVREGVGSSAGWLCDSAWKDVRIIADRTEAVGHVLYYPFIALVFMIVARHPAFDAWTWNVPLVLILSMSVAVTLVSSVVLTRSAVLARRREIELLRAALDRTEEEACRKEIEETIGRIESVRDGAFGGALRNPAFRAVLIPAGSVGVIELVPLLMGWLG